MSQIKRHVGKIKNTGVRCVVIMRKMPGDATSQVAEDREHCLLIETDSLPDMYHQNLMAVVDSTEAQQTHDLYSLLSRRSFGDGLNMSHALHSKGFLRKMSVDNVVLYPLPNQPLSLRMANDHIDGLAGHPTAAQAEVVRNVPQASKDDNAAIARNLLAQADLLELDAVQKREQAYTLDPSLRPQVGRPELSKEEKELRRIKRNEKRRSQYAEIK